MILFLATMTILAIAALDRGPVGRTLHRWLVEAPARRLNRLSPGHGVLAMALVLVGVFAFVLFETEGLRLFAYMAPDLLLWVGAFDVVVFVDAAILAVTVATTTRLKPLIERLRLMVRRARTRATRTRRARKPRRPADDDPYPAFGYRAFSMA